MEKYSNRRDFEAAYRPRWRLLAEDLRMRMFTEATQSSLQNRRNISPVADSIIYGGLGQAMISFGIFSLGMFNRDPLLISIGGISTGTSFSISTAAIMWNS